MIRVIGRFSGHRTLNRLRTITVQLYLNPGKMIPGSPIFSGHRQVNRGSIKIDGFSMCFSLKIMASELRAALILISFYQRAGK